MSIRCVRLALQSRARQSRLAAQGTCSFQSRGRASLSPSQSLLTRQSKTAVVAASPRRTFSSASGRDNGGEGGNGVVAAAPGSDAGARAVEPSFPWRGAPNLVVEPEGLATKIFLSIFSEEFDMSSEDLKVGSEEAFVCAAAAFFKMRPSEVRAPKPSGAGAGDNDGAPLEEDSAAGTPEVEDVLSTEGSEEEEADRTLAAIETGLVSFSSGKEEAVRASGATPYYRLHQVVAAAITSKRVIVGARRGDDISAHVKRVFSPSWIVLVDMEQVGAEIGSAVEGNTNIVLQVDVDIACDETFYVTDGETGEVIQGKKRNTGRIHRIRLETDIGPPANPEPPSWKVVDLDNWLQGNPFW